MREVLLSLDRDELPVQFGVTSGSLVERFFEHAASVVSIASADAPEDAQSIEVETEFEGVFFTHHEFSPTTTALGKDTQWVADSGSSGWVEVRDVGNDIDHRSIILRMNGGMFFVACTAEDFMTTLILSQTPG
jgi:hypothetical protein